MRKSNGHLGIWWHSWLGSSKCTALNERNTCNIDWQQNYTGVFVMEQCILQLCILWAVKYIWNGLLCIKQVVFMSTVLFTSYWQKSTICSALKKASTLEKMKEKDSMWPLILISSNIVETYRWKKKKKEKKFLFVLILLLDGVIGHMVFLNGALFYCKL